MMWPGSTLMTKHVIMIVTDRDRCVWQSFWIKRTAIKLILAILKRADIILLYELIERLIVQKLFMYDQDQSH